MKSRGRPGSAVGGLKRCTSPGRASRSGKVAALFCLSLGDIGKFFLFVSKQPQNGFAFVSISLRLQELSIMLHIEFDYDSCRLVHAFSTISHELGAAHRPLVKPVPFDHSLEGLSLFSKSPLNKLSFVVGEMGP